MTDSESVDLGSNPGGAAQYQTQVVKWQTHYVEDVTLSGIRVRVPSWVLGDLGEVGEPDSRAGRLRSWGNPDNPHIMPL